MSEYTVVKRENDFLNTPTEWLQIATPERVKELRECYMMTSRNRDELHASHEALRALLRSAVIRIRMASVRDGALWECLVCQDITGKRWRIPFGTDPTPRMEIHAPKCPAAPDLGGVAVLYAVGVESAPNQFGMFHGPTPNLQEMLHVDPTIGHADRQLPEDPRFFIFQLENGQRKKIYFWFQQKGMVGIWEQILAESMQ
jgi:hypothetical protein